MRDRVPTCIVDQDVNMILLSLYAAHKAEDGLVAGQIQFLVHHVLMATHSCNTDKVKGYIFGLVSHKDRWTLPLQGIVVFGRMHAQN
jgi:hypothetical protein